ncbi:MAG: YdiU family protein [Betaproteobacteria bacterium]|nr:YdiU family protein [Betaproteobacteria bacterium]
MDWNFDDSYTRLPEPFFTRVRPTPVKAPVIVVLNRRLAEALGLDAQAPMGPEAAGMLAGNRRHPSSRPIAQAYAGHQFGHFTLLGDGRAHLLGEHLTPDGQRLDVQLKGSGVTPYSRRGDGRAALGPMLRECLVAEAMHGFGIPTTRGLAVVATGETVFRETPLPGAILTRVASSHIRVGTFEFAAALDAGVDIPGHSAPRAADGTYTRALADYTVWRHYPALIGEPTRYADLLRTVMERQAALVAAWMRVGFVHGVMNTDNMTVSGETIDFGPCAFVEQYDPATVFSSIDVQGRYAFGNQGRMAQWNLARFAETLLPLLDADPKAALAIAEQMIGEFPALFERHFQTAMRSKLGLGNEEPDDPALIASLLDWMHRSRADYTNTFRDLSSRVAMEDPQRANPGFGRPDFMAWHARWTARLARQPAHFEEAALRMRGANPAVIPRNHRVEEAISAAVEAGDLTPTQRLLDILADPCSETLDGSDYRQLPTRDQQVHETFCGT